MKNECAAHRALALADVARALDGLAARRPAVLVIELPQRCNGGATIPFADLRAASALCR